MGPAPAAGDDRTQPTGKLTHPLRGCTAAQLPKQSFRPPFPKGGRARARCHSRPLGSPLRRRCRPQRCASKVFVHLFQKVADSKGSAFGRWPQPAERFYTSGVFGGLVPLEKNPPPKAPPFCARLGGGGLPDGEVAPQGPEGALAICFLAAAGGPVTEKFLPLGIFRQPGGLALPGGGVSPP